MNISTKVNNRAQKIKVTDTHLLVYLIDGRKLEVPLAWFPRLLNANNKLRNRYRLIGDGIGIHWPDLDEDLSVEGLMSSLL